jgi:Immunity protein 53
MSAIEELQEWYASQCNDDWEHLYGVSIETVDNPGWKLTVDLTETELEGVAFPDHAYGAGADAAESGEWLTCKVEKGQFVGRGGPRKLEEIIKVFVSWARSTDRANG